jgi:hypothetical protein
MSVFCSYCELVLSRRDLDETWVAGRRRCPRCDRALRVTLEPCPSCEETLRDVDVHELSPCPCCEALLCAGCRLKAEVRRTLDRPA